MLNFAPEFPYINYLSKKLEQEERNGRNRDSDSIARKVFYDSKDHYKLFN